MIKRTPIGMLAALACVVALAAVPACKKKDENKDSAKKPMPAKTTNTPAAPAKAPANTGDPAAKPATTAAAVKAPEAAAKTKLLALKFHHDD